MRQRDPDKEHIVKETAIRLLVEGGLEGFSMNKLARECRLSVATLYIYYRDREDLIISIAREKAHEMVDAALTGFHETMSFEEGLRNQWQNRYRFVKENMQVHKLIEHVRNSTYHLQIVPELAVKFESRMKPFLRNAARQGEIEDMTVETFWSIAFAPLYALLRFETEGKNMAGKPFKLTEDKLWNTFSFVIKALVKSPKN